MTMDCEEVQLAIPFVLDDDVEAHYLLEVEQHLETCADCRALLEREVALRETLHRAMDSVTAPESLRQRVRTSIENERRSSHPIGRAWPAMAAAAVLVVFVWQGATGTDGAAELEAVTQRHLRMNPNPDIIGRDAQSLAQYFQKQVNFAVRLPRLPEATQVAGRITHLRDREAVHLVYELPGDKKVSLFVYEAPNGDGTVAETTANNVQIRQIHGYNVARWSDSGIVYSVVSELPAERLTPLIDVVAR